MLRLSRRLALRGLSVGRAGCGGSFGLGTLGAPAQEAGRKDGLFLTVPNPIKGDTAELVRNKILDAVDQPASHSQHRRLRLQSRRLAGTTWFGAASSSPTSFAGCNWASRHCRP